MLDFVNTASAPRAKHFSRITSVMNPLNTITCPLQDRGRGSTSPPQQQQRQPERVGRSGEGSLSVLEHLLSQERAEAAREAIQGSVKSPEQLPPLFFPERNRRYNLPGRLVVCGGAPLCGPSSATINCRSSETALKSSSAPPACSQTPAK
jgi:hypothetical protein